ncbi:unnamed protein product [Tenebrio molitor]|nr:unnamed protein product [Tenebrio molitor]
MVTNYGKLRGKVDRLWVHSCPTMAEEGGLLWSTFPHKMRA